MNTNQAEINYDELQSKTIDWLRFPLTMAIVFIHLIPNVNIQNVNSSSSCSSDIYNIIGILISRVLAEVAVPCFFMFSGFLFFYKLREWNQKVYIKKLRSRFLTLGVPYIVWNIIPIVVFLFLKAVKFDGRVWVFIDEILDKSIFSVLWNFNEWGITQTNIIGWATPLTGPFNFPLWFLRDLIICVVLSPIIYYFIKYTKIYGVLLLGFLFYTKIWFTIPGMSITALFFFSLGAYFSIHNKGIILAFRKFNLFWLITALISTYLSVIFDESKTMNFINPVFIISGVITIINFVSYLLEKGTIKVNDFLSKASFFVYLTHTIFILEFSKVIFSKVFKSQSFVMLTIGYFTIPLFCIFICLTIYFVLNKLTPNLLRILTGNR